jgi:hypothetical protein
MAVADAFARYGKGKMAATVILSAVVCCQWVHDFPFSANQNSI